MTQTRVCQAQPRAAACAHPEKGGGGGVGRGGAGGNPALVCRSTARGGRRGGSWGWGEGPRAGGVRSSVPCTSRHETSTSCHGCVVPPCSEQTCDNQRYSSHPCGALQQQTSATALHQQTSATLPQPGCPAAADEQLFRNAPGSQPHGAANCNAQCYTLKTSASRRSSPPPGRSCPKRGWKIPPPPPPPPCYSRRRRRLSLGGFGALFGPLGHLGTHPPPPPPPSR